MFLGIWNLMARPFPPQLHLAFFSSSMGDSGDIHDRDGKQSVAIGNP